MSGRLEFIAASKWYGQVAALTDLSLELGPGLIGLVGQNGAGKSTCMKLAAGLLRPSVGEVLLCGRPPQQPVARQQLGYCNDLDRYYEDQSGLRFVTAMLRLAGIGRAASRDRAADLLGGRLGLGEAMNRPIKTYSKGMRQRVKLAVALGHEPAVLLLDEPLTGLDPVARREVRELMRACADEGRCVVVSSHVLHELESIADRVVLIHRGKMLAEGTVEEIRDQIEDRPRRMFLGGPDPRALATAVVALPDVIEIEIVADGVQFATRKSGDELFTALTAMGAQGGLEVMHNLDDSLESVYGYLVR